MKKKDIICPNCGKTNVWTPENKFRPFCSERCKMIDLGAWAAEDYKVAGEAIDKNKEIDDED